MGVVLMGVLWVWLAMIWAWTGGVASVLELVFQKLEPMQYFIANGITEAAKKRAVLLAV